MKISALEVVAVKVGALTGKEWDPVTPDRDMQDDPIEAENVEPLDAKGFISPKEINHSLSGTPEVTFTEVDARQDNTDVSQSPPRVISRPITRLEAQHASERERKYSP